MSLLNEEKLQNNIRKLPNTFTIHEHLDLILSLIAIGALV